MRGEVVQAVQGYEFHVLEVDPRRVKRVRIVPLSEADRRRQQRSVSPAKSDDGSEVMTETTETSKEA
ncbi:hypothetical protein D9M69_692690 [compost metagenome]